MDLNVGTPQDAVDGFISMMAAAVNVPETSLTRWLDTYYMLRAICESRPQPTAVRYTTPEERPRDRERPRRPSVSCDTAAETNAGTEPGHADEVTGGGEPWGSSPLLWVRRQNPKGRI